MKKFESIIILAAGVSRRFWPLSHKNLFLFMGQEVISWQIEKLKSLCDKLTIVVSEGQKEIISKIAGSAVRIIVQKGEGQIAGLKSIRDKVAGEALVLNSVDFFDFDNLFNQIREKSGRADVIFCAKKIDQYIPGGYFKLSGGKIEEIVEKPEASSRPSNYFKLVADYFANFEDFLSDNQSGYEDGLNQYIKKKQVTLIEYSGHFYTLKYPWHVLSLSKFFLSKIKTHRGQKISISKTAIIEGEVYLGDNVKVGEYAKIVGPTFIGKNSVIGDFTLVRDSMIGDDCLIGGYSEVARSYLGKKVYLHRNYIGDSVIDDNSLFGAGATTANFRFDRGKIRDTGLSKLGALVGAGVKVGINASIMPGIKIATGKFVSPGAAIMEDIV